MIETTKRSRILPALFILACVMLFVHAPARGQDETRPPEEVLNYDTINDSAEGFNRVMFGFNQGFFHVVINPFSKVYTFLLPQQVRTCIQNAGKNLAYPMRLINNGLQGKGHAAWDETKRFSINTTLGVLGLFDPATKWYNIPVHDEDFAQTLGKWGTGPGPYLVLPLIGPGSGRDTFGRIIDYPFNLASWLVGARPFFSNNDISFKADQYTTLLQTQFDPYSIVRTLYSVDREKDVRDYVIPKIFPNPDPSIGAVFLKPTSDKFKKRGKTRRVRIPTTGRKLAYTYWKQRQRAPWVMILPGLGSHRLSNSSVALAEMVYNHGYNAVSISSTMNFEFIRDAGTGCTPGYPPTDCRDLAIVLSTIRNDLLEKYPDSSSATAILGRSLGAIQTLFLADMQSRGVLGQVEFSGFVAVNPPPDLLYALRQLDCYFAVPGQMPKEERQDFVQNTLMKAIALGKGQLKPTGPIPLTRAESKFLIGLVFRFSLRDLIVEGQRKDNLGLLKHDPDSFVRQPLYHEVRRITWEDYMHHFVLPQALKAYPEKTEADLVRCSSLKSIQGSLGGNPDVRVQINDNDFLLAPGDVAWFSQTFGNRLVRFPDGGHLGNQHRPEVQDSIMRSLAEVCKP